MSHIIFAPLYIVIMFHRRLAIASALACSSVRSTSRASAGVCEKVTLPRLLSLLFTCVALFPPAIDDFTGLSDLDGGGDADVDNLLGCFVNDTADLLIGRVAACF